MDSATIERLIIDRQLNELPPDARALLEAFLAEHPELRSREDDIQRTLRLAAQALASDRQPSMPEPPALLPAGRSAPAFLKPKSWASRLQPLAVAAALLLAFWTGSRFGPGSAGLLERDTQQIARGEVVPDESGFWSLRRADRGSITVPTRDRPVTWNSPTQWPRIGDKS